MDTLQRFMFEHAPIRGEIVRLNTTYTTILNQHPYPPAVKTLLGEALMACVLLTGSIQFEGEVSLQFRGDRRLPLLLVQCDHQLNLRGYAKYQDDLSIEDYQQAFLDGSMSLVITPFQQTQAYQSIVPIQSASLAENLMHYFSQSEQIATRVWFASHETHAVGMLLQLLPPDQHNQHNQNTTLERERFWEYAVMIGETVRDEELLSLDNPTILHRLYHETELRLYPERTISFRCRCHPEKMKHVLTILGQTEVEQLLAERGEVQIHCDFCGKEHRFDPIDIAMLFRK